MFAKRLDLGLQRARPTRASYVALLLALAACAWATQDLLACLDANDEARSALERWTQRSAEARRSAAERAATNKGRDASAAAAAALSHRLDAPWDGTFSVVEAASSMVEGAVSLDSLQQQLTETGASVVAISAHAGSAEAALSFVEALSAQPTVRGARLLDQQKDRPDAATLRFRLVFLVQAPARGGGR